MSIAFKAMQFAREAHKDQLRNYTDEPYCTHLAEVAGIVATLDLPEGPIAIAVAWLHDTVEDTGTTPRTLFEEFGQDVKAGVMLLSDLEEGNRSLRKQMSRLRLATAPGWIQTIKCADLISNTSSIVKHDPKFAVTYLEEKRLLLDAMTRADPRLVEIARKQAEGV
jgi:(p)ppGpp synthase/HD superfamily hydrolase